MSTCNNSRSRRTLRPVILVGAAFLLNSGASAGGDEPNASGLSGQSRHRIVVSVSRPASEVGARILEQGGNAADAAVATAFALAVTWPEAGNIGGGGFMLIHCPDGTRPVVIEYREKAPQAATVELWAKGRHAPQAMVGVPGTVRGLELAHQTSGSLPWESLVLPAARLAEDGFEIGETLAASLNKGVAQFRDNREFLQTFGKEQGTVPWNVGDRLVQKDLAKTLHAIAAHGADGFYQGVTAELFVAEMQRGGGLITAADLAEYQATVRTPIHGTFRGYDIYAPPPPSSGGLTLVQMLNLAEQFDLRQESRWSPRTLHLMIESMRHAYFHRARYLGDPDFIEIPPQLATKEFATEIAQRISATEAGSSAALGADILTAGEGSQTTHFSVIDRNGMAVSNTYTLENAFGSGVVVRGGGFLLNDEMGDFNPQPGVTKVDGQIGTPPNLVAPGKRMLSSMCPVIVAKDGRPVLITGSPGGRTIINTVFCVLINVLEYGMPLRDALDAPRHHHQWLPDRVQFEAGLLSDHAASVAALRALGHRIHEPPVRQGDAHSIAIDTETGLRRGEADRRRGGWAAHAK